MPRDKRAKPHELSTNWPDEQSANPNGEVARQFALNLRKSIGDRSLRAAGDDAGVDHTTILAILAGRTWPDLETISKLEHGLGVDLWPGRISN
jgi:hypothetical protein